MSDEPSVRTVAGAPITEPPPPPSSSLRPLMRSPAHAMHAQAGATLVEEGGWEVPAAYGQPAVERDAIREGLAVCDITARAKVDLRGPIDEILARLSPAEGLVSARISGRWALLLSAPGTQAHYLTVGEAAAGETGLATDATSIYAGYAVCGPRALDFMERITPFDVRGLAPGAATGIQALKVPALLVSCPAPLAIGVFELYVSSEYGRYAWESLLHLGASLDITPVGWDALRAEGWR